MYIVYISEMEGLRSEPPGVHGVDGATPAIETTDIGNSPIINIIIAYTNSIGSRRYSCVLLLSINNTAL